MSKLFLEDSFSGKTYLLLSCINTEFYSPCGFLVPCAVYKAQLIPDMSYCEIKLTTHLGKTEEFSVFGEEIYILKKIRHKHVVELIGTGNAVLSAVDASSKTVLGNIQYLALEWLYDWSSYLNYFSISDSAVRKIFKKIVKTVSFIYSEGVSLADLKFENIQCNSQGVIKITGLAPSMKKYSEFSFISVSTGTETDAKLHSYSNEFTSSMIYKLGIMLLKIRLGPHLGDFMKQTGERLGFHEDSFWVSVEMMLQIKISASLRSLLKLMLCANNSNRLSFTEILSHPWMCLNNTYRDEFEDCETIFNL